MVVLFQLILVSNSYAAAPGTFDCGASGGGMTCAVVTHACVPGTKPDEAVCRNIGRNIAECNVAKDISCIPDANSNTADCVWNRTFCIARNLNCQQGYTDPCSGLSQTECNRAGVQCKLAQSNTSDCVWYPPSNSCQATNINCRSGYAPDCGSRSEANCNATGIVCRSYDVGPGPTIPVYDPGCTISTFIQGGRTRVDTQGVKTALGCLPVNPQNFVDTVLPWAIYLGAGIAFLLGVFGAGMIVLSAGNPEKMQAGKEMITSAIAGVIILVFAVFLLDFIGVKVLKLFSF